MSGFHVDHWPVSLALIVPFLAVVAVVGVRTWAAERSARRRALRDLLGAASPRRAHDTSRRRRR